MCVSEQNIQDLNWFGSRPFWMSINSNWWMWITLFKFFLWIGQCLYMVDGVVLDLMGFDSTCSLPAYPDSLIILGNILLTSYSDRLRSRGLNWRRLRSWTWHACLILSEYPLPNFIFTARLFYVLLSHLLYLLYFILIFKNISPRWSCYGWCLSLFLR